MDLRGLVVLVTGGASGLGAAVVRQVVAAGGRAVVADVDTGRGEHLSAELGELVLFVPTDVRREADMQRAVDVALERWGALHGLVTCAGIVPGELTVGRKGPHRLETFERTIEINLIGTFNAIRLAANAMARNAPDSEGERGVIVATASIAAFDGRAGAAAYASSKAGIVGMTLPIARDLAPLGIRMLTVAPGTFATPLFEALPDAIRHSFEQSAVFPPRAGRPAEFASFVMHAFGNAMLNGEVVRLDGAVRGEAR